MQLEIARHVIAKTSKPFLICMPLAVVGEFKRDNDFLGTGISVEYIKETDPAIIEEAKIYLTNYERVRKGDIDPELFGGVSFDEASILRNLKTETTNYILEYFKRIPYRFVATATPTPNDYIEILNYADYLGVIDRGHALTRFFQRDSTKAGHLTLYPNKKEEFWKWVSTWAVFINKPSDLGYDDTGYDLPKLNIHEIEVKNHTDGEIRNKKGELVLFKDTTKSLVDVSREKAESVEIRVQKAFDIVQENGMHDNWILWHHLESERMAIEKTFKSVRRHDDLQSVYGSQSNEEKENLLIDFSEGKYQILSTKPKIAGSGCNLQHHCNRMIFVGIDFKFNDFIQAIHRVYRFGQTQEVDVYLIHTQNEVEVLKTLKEKWKNHIELQMEMINLVREYGLNTDKIRTDMKRQIFTNRRQATVGGATVYNEDTVLIHQEMPDNYSHMILTSIPFGDHYEYSDNYNDFGHNYGNEGFFQQMDYLTPHLLRTLKPGRIAAIHVKDRIRYSHQTGQCFTKIEDFSGRTVAHFEKHGFHLVGKITITTDVVRENNQTYRLTWGEQRKDATKMGVGLPEYVLLFRKAPSDSNNAYADEPVVKSIEEYLLSLWQLDAHAYWKSSGDRFLTSEELARFDMKTVFNAWKKYDREAIYNFEEHLRVCQDLANVDRLSKLFMTIPPTSSNDLVWTDINRMNTLNANQVNRKREKHICLAEGTLILTQRGYIPIQEVEIGDITLTHKGEWKPIIAKELTRKNAEVVKINAQGVPNLITTNDHKLWCRRHKGYRPSETFQSNAPEWVEAQNTQTHYLNQKLPPVIESDITANDWWVIGRWLADGHIDFRGHQFFISVGKNKIDQFKQMAGKYIRAEHDKGSCVQFPLVNLPKQVRELLFKCGKGASNKVLPIEAISLNKDLSESLLAGYLSGDGHLDKSGQYQISSVSRGLLLGFSIVAQRAWGVIASVYAGKKAGKYTIEGRTVDTRHGWTMTIRKEKRHSFGKILEDGAWKRVRSVESAGNMDVWNIRVAEDESYTAEGCIVKNCPLQLDIIRRLINRFTNPGEIVDDPFGGLFSTAHEAIDMGRKAISAELNPDYYDDGLYYLKAKEYKLSVPTLFDLLEAENN
ncbi:DNA methyltransferase [Leadbetterella byssophila]|uniref:DNA methyltransferase n=1 Tax=Leadbetterella byssophila TaxID=316068 RepID=UPI0039A25B5F